MFYAGDKLDKWSVNEHLLISMTCISKNACGVWVRIFVLVAAGNNSGQVPGPAERLHHPFPGPYKACRAPQGRATSGGGHVSSQTGSLCPGQSRALPRLHRTTASFPISEHR